MHKIIEYFCPMGISFHNADRRFLLKSKGKLKQQLNDIFTFNCLELESLSYVFCSDDYLLGINRQFLKHDFYTDIITFNLGTDKSVVTGEIYISVDRVIENADGLNVAFTEEIHRVIFHGALHLCGFKDKTKAEKLAMRTAEDFWLSNYFQ